MSKYQIADIIRKVRQEQGISEGTGERTQYDFDVKIKVVNLYKEGTDSFSCIVRYLKNQNLGQGWDSVLKRWITQEALGLYTTGNAVSARLPKGSCTGLQVPSLENLILIELEAGKTLYEILKHVTSIEAKWKQSQTEKVREEVEKLLASKGITMSEFMEAK